MDLLSKSLYNGKKIWDPAGISWDSNPRPFEYRGAENKLHKCCLCSCYKCCLCSCYISAAYVRSCYISAAYIAAYVACLLFLCQGPSGLTVRAFDYYSEVLGSNPSWILDFFSHGLFLTLSAKTWAPTVIYSKKHQASESFKVHVANYVPE